MRRVVAVLALLGPGLLWASRPASVLSDLPDDVAAQASARPSQDTAELLERVFAAGDGYIFERAGIAARTDRRWFEGATVEGPGAPVLELRRWPGDTVLALYALPPDGGPGLPGLNLSGPTRPEGAWTARDGTLETPLGRRSVVWGELRAETRRVGALGVAGDAGLGPGAAAGLREEILAVLRRTTLEPKGPAPAGTPMAPDLGAEPRAAVESRDGWQVFQGPGFTIGLPPGIRAIRLDIGLDPPRPLPGASVWLRGQFEDRDGKTVVIGDGRRAGYIARLPSVGEGWTRGEAPPLGAPSAKRIDAAPLTDLASSWTGASEVSAGHWTETGFRGDWLVFRLRVANEGIEIGLPVLESWRSLALFWIPVSWRQEGRPPAPPPIDPAASRGIRFHRFEASERDRNALIEGELFVSDLRLEVPRGVWPSADLRAQDGLPVTFVDVEGRTLGQLIALAPGSPALAPPPGEGWREQERPSARRAAHIWIRAGGSAVLAAPDGHGFAFEPGPAAVELAAAWERLYQSASFTRSGRR